MSEATLVSKNPMDRVIIDKVVVHICVKRGDWERLQKAAKLLEILTKQKPVYRRAKKTIKEFGIGRGQMISTMVTLRGEKAMEFLKKAFEAVGNKVKLSSFDENGNLSFGIKEYLLIPGVKYYPDIGVFGMDVVIALKKYGKRVSIRRYKRSRVGKRARVTKEEAVAFIKETFNVEIV